MNCEIKSVCVYCASSNESDEVFFRDAHRLGEILAREGLRLVYGAGIYGLMGAVCEGCQKSGGKVTGVIPSFMVEKGWNKPGLDETLVVETMHERKRLMCEIGDAAIALPGGVGTLDEFMDSLSLKKLGLYNKPLVLLNTKGFFDPLISLLDKTVEEHFMRPEHRKMYAVASTPEEAVELIYGQEAWDSSKIDIAAI